jgi:uncharacterized protein YndB with AHSA1/START domain
MDSPPTIHATLVFERSVPATADRVFAAYADLEERMKWGAPSDNTALIYDEASFVEGEEDVFRCGPKADPNIHGITHYLNIVPAQRIVSSETITMNGQRLCASLSTLEFHADGDSTKLKVTVQLASFVGQEMVKGHENGTNASLDNLLGYFRELQHS